MKIFDHLEEMYEFLRENDWDDLEAEYRERAEKWSGKKVADKIHSVKLKSYANKLEDALTRAVETAESLPAKAVYFEYDIDNDWKSYFYICPEYYPENEEEEEWAGEWEERIKGPSLPAFAKIYDKNGGHGDDDSGNGVTLYLISRTVAALGRALDDIPSTSLAVCIGYHDQEPIWRLQENEEEI